ncbi:MAG: nucleotide-binding domain containing protein, partial [bacterium]
KSIDPSDFGYIVSKGGITSHTILSEGFACSSAKVLGPILPGVPVVCLETSNTPFIIFPGNVGDEKSLLRVQQILSPNIS